MHSAVSSCVVFFFFYHSHDQHPSCFEFCLDMEPSDGGHINGRLGCQDKVDADSDRTAVDFSFIFDHRNHQPRRSSKCLQRYILRLPQPRFRYPHVPATLSVKPVPQASRTVRSSRLRILSVRCVITFDVTDTRTKSFLIHRSSPWCPSIVAIIIIHTCKIACISLLRHSSIFSSGYIYAHPKIIIIIIITHSNF